MGTTTTTTTTTEMISEAAHVRQQVIHLSESVQRGIDVDDVEVDALRTLLEGAVVTISELLCFMAENDLTSRVAYPPNACAN